MHNYAQEGEENDWKLKMPGYEHEDYELYNRQLVSGEKLLNLSAVNVVYAFMVRALTRVINSLNELIFAGADMSYSQVRKFVVDFYMLEMSDYWLYSAMNADIDDLFYQNRATS